MDVSCGFVVTTMFKSFQIEENRSKLLNYLHIFTFVIGLPQGVPIQLVNGRRRITKTEKKEEATGLTKAASSREVNP